jgi:dihydrofolate synthase/folylpolyglutamate synthase
VNTLERLERLKNWERGPRSRMQPTIAPMRDLMARLGNPHQAFRSIHVTGTKGKGSVCALLEAALHEAGLRVGRYASPHIHSICERVSLRRKLVSEDRLTEALGQVLDLRDEAALAGSAGADATWFDVLTAAAFLLFAREKLEWVVVEVGLGGRLDSTNVVNGTVCVVTNIGLEHTDVLGATLAEIAREKAGIIKPGCLVVTGAQPATAAGEVIRAHAAQQGACVTSVAPLPGITAANLATARAVLDAMGALGIESRRAGRPLDATCLDDPLARLTRLPGRFELWSLPSQRGPVPLVIDGAHVDIAVEALLDEASTQHALAAPLFCLMALGRDKAARRMLAPLRGRARHIVFIPLAERDCWTPEELVALGAELGISCSPAASAREGIEACSRLANERGWLLAAGSLHLVEEARAAARALGARAAR